MDSFIEEQEVHDVLKDFLFTFENLIVLISKKIKFSSLPHHLALLRS